MWIQKQERYNIFKALYKALFKEVPTDQTEEELIRYENKENFASFQISRLFNSDFDRKSKKSCAFTLFSPTELLSAATPAAPALHTSPSTTSGPSAQALANTFLYPIHTSGTKPISRAYMQPPGIRPTPGAYMQFSGIGPLSVVYTQPSGTTPGKYIQPLGSTSAAYIQPPGIKLLLAAYASPGIGFTLAAYTILAMLNISTGHGKELSNLAKIFTNNAKYSGHNNSFTFQLIIFHDICLRVDVLPKTKIKAFLTMFKSLALNYYYSNISISIIAMNFNQVCNFIRNYFEGAKYKQSILLK